MILTINGQQVALKKGASIEYVSENRIFTDASFSIQNRQKKRLINDLNVCLLTVSLFRRDD